MSLSEIIPFPFIPKDLYTKFRETHKTNVKDLDSFKKGLEKLVTLSLNGDKLAQTIIIDLYLSIHHESIFKENITGKRIEDKFSELFALSTGDNMRRENPLIETLMDVDQQSIFEPEVLYLVTSNYREKGDLFFVNTRANAIYKISIKSLVPSNREINFGAFEFLSTIKGIPELEPLLGIQERSRTIEARTLSGITISNLGLGSSRQLKNVWNFITNSGKQDEYLSRFRILLSAVYKDDFLIYIKDPMGLKMYLLRNEEFINIVISKVSQGFSNMRMEGNGIRITDLNHFKECSTFIFEYSFDDLLPNKYEILSILSTMQQEKSDRLRRFCS